jgi:hypothetical protein
LLVKAWHHGDHARPFKRAVEAIGEDPETVSSYAAFSRPAGGARRQTPRYISLAHRKTLCGDHRGSHDELVRASMIEMDRPAAEVVPIRKA